MINLRSIAQANGYRVTMDPTAAIEPSRAERAWLLRVPCQRGHIGVHGEATLSAYVTVRTARRLMAVDGVRVVQRGDHEARVVFGVEHLPEVARVLQPHRRRRLSPEARQAATDRLDRHRLQAAAAI